MKSDEMPAVKDTLARDATYIPQGWHDRFKYKWPSMTTMMHQSEITIQPHVQLSTIRAQSLDSIYRNKILPEWANSNHDIHSDPQTMDNDILQEDLSISGVSVSPARHNKRCRNFLCVFILFSIITVAAAAIGAAIYLTYDHQDVSSYNNTNNNQHHHADHIDWDLHHDDQAYLTEKFCDLMKALLASVDFPVRIGIESCTTSLKTIKGSEGVHLELHMTPKRGFTIREKINRALKEKTLEDGIYGMLGRKDVMHTSGNTINLGNVSDFIDSKWDFESHVIVKSNSSVTGGNDERISSHNTTKAPGRASAFVLGAVDFADEGRITLIDAILSMSESPNVTNHTDHANTIASKVSGLTTKENVQPVADNLVVMNTTGDDNLNGKFRKLLSPQQYKVSTEAANFNMKNLPTTGNQISNPIFTTATLKESTQLHLPSHMISTADYFLNWIDDASTTRTPTTTIPESVNIKTSIGRFEGARTLVADGSDLNKKSKNVDIWSGKNGKAALLDSNLSLTQKVAENSTHVDSIVNAKGNYFGKKQVMLETLETRNETPEKTHGSSSFVTTAKTVVDSKDLQEVASSAQQKTIGQSPQKSFVNEDTHFEIANEFHGQTDTSSNEAVVSVKSLNSHKLTSSATDQLNSNTTQLKAAQGIIRAPVATKLFNLTEKTISSPVETSSVSTETIPPKSPKQRTRVVDSLMSDDAQKLPFRTNSNFRFLFSSDTRHSQDEPQVALPVSRSAQAFQTNHALLGSA